MSSIFLLPKQLGFQPVGIDLELPKMVGGWYGTDLAVSEKERIVLGEGTEFARKSYRNGRGYEIVASIVLSGQDMNTSIHRPERCMPAQGFTVIDKRSVPLALPGHELLRVTRLRECPQPERRRRRAVAYLRPDVLLVRRTSPTRRARISRGRGSTCGTGSSTATISAGPISPFPRSFRPGRKRSESRTRGR